MGNSPSELFLNGTRGDSSNAFGPQLDTLIKSKDWSQIIILIQSSPDVLQSKHPTSGQSPLSRAICRQVHTDVVKEMVKVYSEACFDVDKNGWLPIHHAVCNHCPPELIKLLLSVNPHSITVPDFQGQTCLHFASKFKLPLESFNVILNAYPMAAAQKTKTGALPLHYAAQNRQSASAVQLLVDTNPLAVKESLDGKFPIHLACENRADETILKTLMSVNSLAAQDRAANLMLPIHICAANKADLGAICYLVRCFPDGLILKDRTGRIPLHYALERQAPAEVVEFLVNSCPDSLKMRGYGGNFPLHVVLERQYHHAAVVPVLEGYPEAAAERDMFVSSTHSKFSVLPLARAINNAAPDDQILAILEAFPRAAEETDDYLRIPLHYAIGKKLSVAVINALLSIFPAGGKLSDKNGQMALHLSVKRSSPLEVIRRLYDVNPSSLHHKDSYGMTPLHHAIEVESSLPSLLLLLSLDSSCASERYGLQLPLHLAIELKRFELIEPLLKAFPSGALDTESELSRLPLQSAIHARAPYNLLLSLYEQSSSVCGFCEDANGLLSIHYAVKYKEPVDLVVLLIQLNPELLYVKDLPIYFNDIEVPAFIKKQLVKEDFRSSSTFCSSPRAQLLEAREFEGRISLSFSPKPKSGDESSSSASIRGKTLLHYATEICCASQEVVAAILKHTMPIATDGTLNPRHNYCWSYILSETGDKYWQAVEEVLQDYDTQGSFDLIRKLSEVPDEIGRRAVDIATNLCQKALLRRLYFFIRYELHPLPYCHVGEGCLVQLAWDHHDKKRLVALKFMKSKEIFEKEVNIRLNYDLVSDYVVPILRSHNGDIDALFRDETQRRGLFHFNFCIVLAAAERTLVDAIHHEHFIGGKNWQVLRELSVQICEAIAHLHDRGVIHGDIKARNIVRQDGRMKLIDLGCATCYVEKEIFFVGAKFVSSACLPPELFTSHSSTSSFCTTMSQGRSIVNSRSLQPLQLALTTKGAIPQDFRDTLAPKIATDSWVKDTDPRLCAKTGLPLSRKTTYDELKSEVAESSNEPSQSILHECTLSTTAIDIWSLGVLLFLLFTGENLFLASFEDSIDTLQLTMLADWTESLKLQRLARISNPCARGLVSQLLSKDPLRRPDMGTVLRHPFLTGAKPSRLLGMEAEFDVCIVYRNAIRDDETCLITGFDDESTECSSRKSEIDTDGVGGNIQLIDKLLLAERIHAIWLKRLLKAKGLKVVECDDACTNLIKSRASIVILSRFSTNVKENSFQNLNFDSPLDPFLLKLKLMLELPSFNILEGGIHCLLVGDRSDLPPDATTEPTWEEIDMESAVENKASIDTHSKSRTFTSLNQGTSHVSFSEAIFDYNYRESDDGIQSTNDEGASLSCRHFNWFEDVSVLKFDNYFGTFRGDVVGRHSGAHSGNYPPCTVKVVDDSVTNILEKEALGSPTRQHSSIAEVMRFIVDCNPIFVSGCAIESWNIAATIFYESLLQPPESRPHNFTADGIRPLSPLSPAFLNSLGLRSNGQSYANFPVVNRSSRTPQAINSTQTRKAGLSDFSREQEFERDIHFTSVAFSDNNAATATTIALLEHKIFVRETENSNLQSEVDRLTELMEIRLKELNGLRAQVNMKPYDGK